MSYFRPIYLVLLLFSIFAMGAIQPSPSKATNFFKWLAQRNKQEQPPSQMIEQKIYKLPRKTIIQKSVPKQKEENVKRVLVLGDFMASATANALKKLFTHKYNIIIINNTVPDSGLVRTDHYSWKNNISQLIDINKPDAIVMMIGANDNQPIIDTHSTFNTEQPEWLNIYKQRIIEIVESLHTSGKRWIWIGQPAFGNENLTQKMRIFNALYKQEVEEEGGYFIDIWNSFIDEQGQFSFSGYDINGNVVRLRTNDGINLTSEGKEKLASYLEKKLEILLNAHIPSYEDSSFITSNTPTLKQKSQNIERQSPISLNDMAQQNTDLLDKMDQIFVKKSWFPSNGHQKNRADNFSLL
ncbi:SGNH family hydrolase [Bartonella doshiae]|uniref:SGNH/GDSL hydrolase family protein n=2 Tax=Bartonella doshiae TaxID=33044 RepID=UPI000A678951|nr:SGNH family hydrolase [Bartonella doshiae]